MLPPKSTSLRALEAECGVGKSTLFSWKQKAIQMQGLIVASGSNKKRSAGEKFLAVMESYAMNEAELSKYCREKGLYMVGVISS